MKYDYSNFQITYSVLLLIAVIGIWIFFICVAVHYIKKWIKKRKERKQNEKTLLENKEENNTQN